MKMKDKAVIPDTLLSAALSVVMLCVLRQTVVIEFSLLTIMGFVLFWHVLLMLVDNLRPPPLAVGTVLVLLAVAVVFLALRGGDEETGHWLDGYIDWAMAAGGHNAPDFFLYRTVTIASISMVFSLAVFLLIRCEAHVGLLLAVGSSVFLGMQWAGFPYPAVLLWLFLFLMLLMAFRQGEWKGGQQGLMLLFLAPFCAVLIFGVSRLPLDRGPAGLGLIERIGAALSRIESPFDLKLFTFSGAQGDSSDINRDLGGAFQPSDRTMLYLTADKPLYVKSRSAREYTGRRWLPEDLERVPFEDPLFSTQYPYVTLPDLSALQGAGFRFDPAPSLAYALERYQFPVTVNFLDDPGFRPYSLRRATIHYGELVTHSVFTPEGFLSFRPRTDEEKRKAPFTIDASQAVISERKMVRDDSYELYYLDYHLASGEWDQVLDTSSPSLTEALYAVSGDAFMRYSAEITDEVYANYLMLPPSLPDRVRELARSVTRKADTIHQCASAIETFLSTTFPYSTDVPDTPEGVDFVDYFLFDLHKGYCTYYATAMVVMCRAIGIPARYVEGFKFSSVKEGGRYVATGAQAHAWAEVYLDGFGWIAYEPTAGFSEEFHERYRDTSPTPEPTRTPNPSPTPTEEPPPSAAPVSPTPSTPTEPPSTGQRTLDFLQAAGWLLLRWSWLLLLAAWVFFNFVRYKRYRKGLQTARYGRQSLRRLHKRGQRMLALLGYRPEAWETPLEFSLRCGAEFQDAGVLAAFTEGYYRTAYGGLRPGPEERKAAAAALLWLESVLRSGKLNAARLWLLRFGLGWI